MKVQRLTQEAPEEGRTRRRRRPAVRFVLCFIVLLAGFFGVTSLPWFWSDVFPPYLKLNAVVSAWLLRLLGESATVSGWTISTPRFALEIQRGCDAIDPIAIFVVGVLAFPSGWRRKVPGLAVGIAALLLLNQVRIVSLYYVGVHAPGWFEAMHVEVWQPIFIVIAALLWLAWIWRMNRRADARQVGIKTESSSAPSGRPAL